MTINRILVIDLDRDWQGLYRKNLSRKFPHASVDTLYDRDIDVASLRIGRYDLCITVYKASTPANFPAPTIRAELGDNLRQRVSTLREANPNIKIAVVTGYNGLERVAESLGIAYIHKTAPNIFQRWTDPLKKDT